jgi:hypothetical protein
MRLTDAGIFELKLSREISKAISAHGIWKVRLQAAIESGKLEVDIADVARDDVCEFGRWLHGESLSPEVKEGPTYKSVTLLHARFHRCAATVLECVAAGDHVRAHACLAGEYSLVSSRLVSEMVKWKRGHKATSAD